MTGKAAAATHISPEKETSGILRPGPRLCSVLFRHGHRVALFRGDVL